MKPQLDTARQAIAKFSTFITETRSDRMMWIDVNPGFIGDHLFHEQLTEWEATREHLAKTARDLVCVAVRAGNIREISALYRFMVHTLGGLSRQDCGIDIVEAHLYDLRAEYIEGE